MGRKRKQPVDVNLAGKLIALSRFGVLIQVKKDGSKSLSLSPSELLQGKTLFLLCKEKNILLQKKFTCSFISIIEYLEKVLVTLGSPSLDSVYEAIKEGEDGDDEDIEIKTADFSLFNTCVECSGEGESHGKCNQCGGLGYKHSQDFNFKYNTKVITNLKAISLNAHKLVTVKANHYMSGTNDVSGVHFNAIKEASKESKQLLMSLHSMESKDADNVVMAVKMGSYYVAREMLKNRSYSHMNSDKLNSILNTVVEALGVSFSNYI